VFRKNPSQRDARQVSPTAPRSSTNVLPPMLREEEARREACLARADHDRVDALHARVTRA
jgi:hypothetical protein